MNRASTTSEVGTGDPAARPGDVWPRRPVRTSRLRDFALLAAPPLLVALAVLGLWYFVTYRVLDPNRRLLLPPLHDVIQEGLLTWEWLSEILKGLWSTTQVAIIGLGLAIVIGIGLAVVMVQSSWIERSVFPYAVLTQAIPIVAIVPLIGLWFGFDFKSRIVVTVIISVFPVITNTLFGLKSVDRNHHDLFRLHGAGRATRLVKLQFPSATPAIFTGLRISAGLAVIGAIVGDFFFRKGDPGIGRLLSIYQDRLQAEQLITAIFFSSLLGLVLFTGFGLIGHRLTWSWHPSAQRIRRAARRRPRGKGEDAPVTVPHLLYREGTETAGAEEAPIGAGGTMQKLAGYPRPLASDRSDREQPPSGAGRRRPAVFGRPLERAARLVGPPMGLAAVVTGGWYLFSYVVLQPQRRFLMPPPHQIWTEGLANAASRSQLFAGLQTTGKVAIAGLFIAMVIGVIAAILMSQAAWAERALYPWAVVLQTVPILALVPLVGLWFGYGFTGRVIVCVLISLFPIITNTLFGLQSAEEGQHDLFSLHQASRSVRFRKLELPAATPAVFTGFRIAAGLSVIGAIVGEFFFQRGERGLGNLLDLYRGQLATPEMFAALLLSSLLGIAVFWLFTWLGRALTKSWHESALTTE